MSPERYLKTWQVARVRRLASDVAHFAYHTYVSVVFFYHAARFVRTVPVYVVPIPVGYKERHIANPPANLACLT